MEDMLSVSRINSSDTYEWLLHKHYAKRLPQISYAFGLYNGAILIGVCTFGLPGGACLSKGLFGGKFIDRILELNRLVINDNTKNAASFFVAQCIKQLPSPLCIVSFADSSQGHHGYVYQATNFLYTGKSAKRTEWVIEGMEHLHSKSIADIAKKGDGRWDELKRIYGDRLGKRDRPSKHRYVYLKGNKSEKKEMLDNLKHEVQQYPKGDNRRYDASYKPTVQALLFA